MDDSIKGQIATSWDKWSYDYDNQYSHGLKSSEEEDAWKNALKNLFDNKVNKVLDVGTGTGFLALLLAELGNEVKGIDISEGMMEKAKVKAKRKKLDINFEYGDAENLNEKDNSYDIVINRHLLWTIPHPEQAINQWIRVLKPGGKLIIIDGDWFHKNTKNQISVFFGKLLVATTELKNPWKTNSGYDENLKENLPMIKDANARKVVSLIEKSRLKDIKISSLDEVEKAEREAMPLKQRLLNPYKRIVIEGIKP